MIHHRHYTSLWLFLVLVCYPAMGADPTPTGIPNFHHVNEHIYRGGQPSSEGWDSLTKLGVKTVIDLRPANEHSTKEEEREVRAAGMRYINVPLSGLGAPPDQKISEVLTLLDPDSAETIFVHCRRGADRTGTVIACYRIAHDHWKNQKALQEAKSYGMSWLEFAMQRYVLYFQPTRMHAATATIAAPAATTN
jgi:tyrosine-protein phosphatase SIW14